MATVKTREQLVEENERLKAQIEKKHGKSAEQLYTEREKRLRDAVELKEPDRVPLCLEYNFFPGRYVGNLAHMYSDAGAWRDAGRQILLDFEPDVYIGSTGGSSGEALSLLGPTGFKWPGDGLDEYTMPQHIETEPMKADEYDLFITDPGDFVLRYYLPRVWKAMAPLAKLPPLQSLVGASTLAGQSSRFSTPEVIAAFEALFEAGREQQKYRQTVQSVANFDEEMASLGFPPFSHPGGVSGVPFDVLADNLRQLRGVMMDIYQRPDKLLAACQKIWDYRLAQGLTAADPKKRGNPKIVSAGGSHHGGDGWMSKKHFETFIWPFWQKAMLINIDLGFINHYRGQGYCDSRLEYFLQIPKGKLVVQVCETDAAKAKEVLAGHHCVMGGVPYILLQSASPPEVEEHVKKLIKTCGKGGGYILSTSARLTHEARPENVKAMVDAVKKYGWY